MPVISLAFLSDTGTAPRTPGGGGGGGWGRHAAPHGTKYQTFVTTPRCVTQAHERAQRERESEREIETDRQTHAYTL